MYSPLWHQPGLALLPWVFIGWMKFHLPGASIVSSFWRSRPRTPSRDLLRCTACFCLWVVSFASTWQARTRAPLFSSWTWRSRSGTSRLTAWSAGLAWLARCRSACLPSRLQFRLLRSSHHFDLNRLIMSKQTPPMISIACSASESARTFLVCRSEPADLAGHLDLISVSCSWKSLKFLARSQECLLVRFLSRSHRCPQMDRRRSPSSCLCS